MYQIVYHNQVEGHELFVVKIVEFPSLLKSADKRQLYSGTLRHLLDTLGLISLIQKDIKGMPSLVHHPNINISISHRDEYVFIGFSEDKIGVDIERHSPNLSRGRDYYLSEVELGFSWTDEELLLIWCAKEALFKKMGGGTVKPELDFCFDKETNTIVHQSVGYKVHRDFVGAYTIVWV